MRLLLLLLTGMTLATSAWAQTRMAPRLRLAPGDTLRYRHRVVSLGGEPTPADAPALPRRVEREAFLSIVPGASDTALVWYDSLRLTEDPARANWAVDTTLGRSNTMRLLVAPDGTAEFLDYPSWPTPRTWFTESVRLPDDLFLFLPAKPLQAGLRWKRTQLYRRWPQFLTGQRRLDGSYAVVPDSATEAQQGWLVGVHLRRRDLERGSLRGSEASTLETLETEEGGTYVVDKATNLVLSRRTISRQRHTAESLPGSYVAFERVNWQETLITTTELLRPRRSGQR